MRDSMYDRLTDVSKCWCKDTCENVGTDKCKMDCVQFTQMDYMFQMSNLPKKCWRVPTLETDVLSDDAVKLVGDILYDIVFFVKKGYNLYLYGDTGTGKTTLAVKLLGTYFKESATKSNFHTRGLFVNVPSFLRDAKLNMTYTNDNFREFLSDIQKCDLVVWDELCQTDPTAFESQWLYSYINERIMNEKSNIFTSNLSLEEFDIADKRLSSRVCSCSDCIHFSGEDRRHRMRYSDFRENSCD